MKTIRFKFLNDFRIGIDYVLSIPINISHIIEENLGYLQIKLSN